MRAILRRMAGVSTPSNLTTGYGLSAMLLMTISSRSRDALAARLVMASEYADTAMESAEVTIATMEMIMAAAARLPGTARCRRAG